MDTHNAYAREFAALLAGDERTWEQLVRRLEPRLRRELVGFHLTAEDADEVVQVAWLELYRSLHTIHNPGGLLAWLIQTARRTAMRPQRRRMQVVPTEDPYLGDSAAADGTLETVLAGELREILERALETLPPRHRELMSALLDDRHNYRELSAALKMPLGSIGPIRARCLDRLAQEPEIRALRAA